MSTATSTQPTANTESFAALFEESIAKQEMRSGEVITAEVVAIDNNFVTVNAGLKSESLIPVEEFHNDRGELDVNVGDFVPVAIESLEDGFGSTKLSRDRAKRLAAWLDLEAAMEEGRIVKGVVQGKVKGGLTVMCNGIRAFLPGSLVDVRPIKDTTPYEGKEAEFKVIKLDRKRNNVVVSRKAVLEESMGAEREALLESLKEGAIVKGIVGQDVDTAAAAEAAKLCGLALIAQLRAACGGDLDRVRRVVKLTGFVNAVPGFGDQPEVVNGCSDLMVAVFGEAGRHARAAVGAGSLPRNVPVEIEGVFQIG